MHSAPAPGPDLTSHRRDRIVTALERLDDVVAANVEFDQHGSIERIRVAALPGTDEEQLRRQLHTCLRAMDVDMPEGELSIGMMSAAAEQARSGQSPPPGSNKPPGTPENAGDPRRPLPPRDSTAARAPEPQTPPEPQAPPPPWHGRFLVLDGVDVERREHRVSCTVRISRLGEAFRATVEEIDSPAGRARAAARATLRAAEQAGEGVRLSLEGVVIHNFFGREYVAAFVEATANRRFASLSGILAVEQSLETAASLAILRAVERWVAW